MEWWSAILKSDFLLSLPVKYLSTLMGQSQVQEKALKAERSNKPLWDFIMSPKSLHLFKKREC